MEQGFESSVVLFYSPCYKVLVQWSKRSHSKMVASMFAHSSKLLIENINTKQWGLNEHSQFKKNRNPHVKSLYLHIAIT